MKAGRIFWAQCLVAVVFAFMAETGWAQRPAHYYPVRPPLSPYFGYSQLNSTGLPNYYMYVQPAQQYRSFLLRQQASTSPTAGRMILSESQISEAIERQLQQRATTGAGAPALPATFMDYDHFYPSSAAARRRR